MPDSPYLGNDSAAITAEALTPGGVPASPDTSNLPASSGTSPGGNPTVTPPTDNSYGNLQASPPPQGKGKGSFMSDILHAIGEVLGGPSSVKQVDPETGKLIDHPLSRTERIANTAGIYLRGASAGAAQHGPAAAGKAALAGATEQQQFQQQQQENALAQSKNVRETNAAEQEKQMNAARLQLMSQQSARLGIDVKTAGLEYDQNQLAVINARQKVLNQPGVKLLQHFDSNSDINDHLETVGPVVAKKYAIDLAANDIQLLPSPKGGFDAVEIPKDLGDKAIGPGMKVHRLTMDPKTNKLKISEEDADPSTTWNKYNLYEGSVLNAYNGNQEFTQRMNEGIQKIKTEKSEEYKNYAEAHRAIAETGIKGADEMIDKGRNPFTNEQLNINNAPDTQPVDAEGHPIPFKSLSFMKPAPTEVQRATFAKSVLHILDSVDDLKAQGKLPNGPVQGLTKQVLAKAGLGDEDAQKALNYISLAQTAATGAHVGGRFSTQVMDKLGQLLKLNMNDSQFSGAEESIRDVMDGYIKAGGRMTAGEWKNDHAVYVNNQLVGYASDDGRGMIPVATK